MTPPGLRAAYPIPEKAIYEVNYELANRPGWVAIPLVGILRLVATVGRDEHAASS